MSWASVVAIALLVSGCSWGHSTKSGDLAAFLVAEIERYGLAKELPRDVPAIEATWTVQRDDSGFAVDVQAASVEDLDAFFGRLYGSPLVVEQNTEGLRQRVLRVAEAQDGQIRSIQYIETESGISIICVRGTSARF